MDQLDIWHVGILGKRLAYASGPLNVGYSRHQKMPCPRLDMLNADILDAAAVEFDKLFGLDLPPAYMATHDGIRTQINDAVSAMLNMPDCDTMDLTRAWCAEPGIRGPDSNKVRHRMSN